MQDSQSCKPYIQTSCEPFLQGSLRYLRAALAGFSSNHSHDSLNVIRVQPWSSWFKVNMFPIRLHERCGFLFSSSFSRHQSSGHDSGLQTRGQPDSSQAAALTQLKVSEAESGVTDAGTQTTNEDGRSRRDSQHIRCRQAFCSSRYSAECCSSGN